MVEIGFGCMRLPLKNKDDMKSVNIEEVKKMVDVYMDHGHNYFDTGYHYHQGRSEIALKEALIDRYPRDSYLLADKMPIYAIKKPEEPSKIFPDQIKKLGVDYFDYYLMHNVSPMSEAGYIGVESFEYVKKQLDAGRIKHMGISSHADAEYIENILNEHPEIEFIQLQINYLDWENDQIQSHKCYDVAKKFDLPVIVMEPLKGGFLASLPDEALNILREFNDDSPVKWALRFLAGLDDVKMILSGASSLEQMTENVEIFDDIKPLNSQEQEALEKVVEVINSNVEIACTKCNYCIDYCPQKINIPKLFELYNFDKIQDIDGFTAIGNSYANHARMKRSIASDCIECNSCVEKCPQHLDIPGYMKQVAKHFETEMYGFEQSED